MSNDEAIAKGFADGMNKGLEKGMEKSVEKSVREARNKKIDDLYKSGKTPEEISKTLFINVNEVLEVLNIKK